MRTQLECSVTQHCSQWDGVNQGEAPVGNKNEFGYQIVKVG